MFIISWRISSANLTESVYFYHQEEANDSGHSAIQRATSLRATTSICNKNKSTRTSSNCPSAIKEKASLIAVNKRALISQWFTSASMQSRSPLVINLYTLFSCSPCIAQLFDGHAELWRKKWTNLNIRMSRLESTEEKSCGVNLIFARRCITNESVRKGKCRGKSVDRVSRRRIEVSPESEESASPWVYLRTSEAY